MDNILKIINYLGKYHSQSFTMHELSQLLKIPYASFYRTINKNKDVLVTKNVGKATTIQLDMNNPIIKHHLILASYEEKKDYLQHHPIINKITNELQPTNTVLLFGSYANNTQTERSDIDLFIINQHGKKDISFSKYEILFKKKINPIFMTKTEFKLMLKQTEENLGKQILKNHIILCNPELFWEAVLNGI